MYKTGWPTRWLQLGCLGLVIALVLMIKPPHESAFAQIIEEPAEIGAPLEQASKGAIITFGGKDWILIDPAERKLLLKNPSSEMYFWGYDYKYNVSGTNLNSTYRYLNARTDRDGGATFYSSLDPDTSWIVPHSFNVTSDTGATMSLYGAATITVNVGLLTLDEYNTYRTDSKLNIGAASGSWYLLTPHQFDSPSTVGVYYVNGSSTAQVQPAANLATHHYNMRPVLYLKSGLSISGGNGTPPTPYTLIEEKSTIQLNPSSPTSGPVTVTITYPPNSSNRTYRLEASESFSAYTEPVSISENSVIHIQYDNPNRTEESFNVTNIIVPSPTITVAPVEPSTRVTVTITYAGNPSIKQYSLDGGVSWLTYSEPFSMTANGSVKARAQDRVGIYSNISTFSVHNIDNIAPAAPTIIQHTSLPAASVTVNIAYPSDAHEKLYHSGTGIFIPYTGEFTMTANGTIYAKAKDLAGNESALATLTISNIAQPAPVITGVVHETTYTTAITPGSTDTGLTTVLLRDGQIVAGYTLGSIISSNGRYELTVSKAGGASSTVTFTIAIPAASALLNSLKIGNTVDSLYSLSKHAEEDRYTATVASNVYTLYVAATSADPAAAITINGVPASSGSPFAAHVPLLENTLVIQVTSSDNTTVKTYTLVVSKSEALLLKEAVTSINGSSILLTFDQPIQRVTNSASISLSRGHTVTGAVYSSTTLTLSLDQAILPAEVVTISVPAGIIYGVNGVDSPSVSGKKVMNRVLEASGDGSISVKQILSQLSSQQDADGDGIFDKADVIIWLQYIQARFIAGLESGGRR